MEDGVGELLPRADGLVRDRGRPLERPRGEERRRQRRQQLGAFELRLDHHQDRPLEQADLAGKIAQPVGERGRCCQRTTGAQAELGGLRGADHVQTPVRRLELMADQALRAGLRVVQTGEPVGLPLVQAGAGGLGQGVVGRLADELVPEPVRPVAGDEAAPPQRAARGLDLGQGHALRDGVHRLRGELVPADGGVAEHGPLGRVERVEASGEERMDRRRQGVVSGPLVRVRGELLQEQRVAGGRLGDAAERVRVARPRDDGLEDAPAFGGREGAQVEDMVAPPDPGRTGVPKLGPGQADEHPSALAGQPGDRLHELQQPGPGPLRVVEHDHDGELAGEGAEQPAQRPRRLLTGRSRPEARDGREPLADLGREAER